MAVFDLAVDMVECGHRVTLTLKTELLIRITVLVISAQKLLIFSSSKKLVMKICNVGMLTLKTEL